MKTMGQSDVIMMLKGVLQEMKEARSYRLGGELVLTIGD
jgi:hypothetical protein